MGAKGEFMLKQISNSVMTLVATCAGYVGNYLNQLPEKAIHYKTRVFKPAPWTRAKKTHQTSHINQQLKDHAQGSAHHETKVFNHPRK